RQPGLSGFAGECGGIVGQVGADAVLPRAMRLPRLYPILDAGVLAVRGVGVEEFAGALLDAGVTLLQYRDKDGTAADVLRNAALIRGLLAGRGCTLMMNDRADWAVLAEWGGVHVGQEDLSPEDARRIVGINRLIGVSTHTDEQV